VQLGPYMPKADKQRGNGAVGSAEGEAAERLRLFRLKVDHVFVSPSILCRNLSVTISLCARFEKHIGFNLNKPVSTLGSSTAHSFPRGLRLTAAYTKGGDTT